MCLKKRCWLSKHTKEESKNSRNRFKKRFGQQFNRKPTKYIANFEKIEFSLVNNLDNKYLDEIKLLIIDVLSPLSRVLNSKNSKTFFILLGLIEKAEEMATNLTNRSFSHFFITIGNVSPNHINSANTTCDIINTNLFAYITSDWYLSDKFYWVMINTNISKHFTAGYGQFLAYIKNIKDINIDVSKASAIYVQFGIDSISFMRSVLIQILIEHIKFYIVKTNTPFLLYFADMNRLDIYFNKINNSLVIKNTCILVIYSFDHPFLL